MDDSSQFIIEILVELIDRAGPGLAKLAGEIEALKKVAGAETIRTHPTVGLDEGLKQTTRSIDEGTTKIRQHREEVERTSRSVSQHETTVRRTKTSLDDYTRSAGEAGNKQQKLAEQAERLDAVMGDLQDAFRRQTTLTREQEVEAQRLVQEWNKLAKAYEIGSEEARQYALEAKAVQDILNESKKNLADYTSQQVANARAVHDLRMQEQRDTDARLQTIQKEQQAHQELTNKIQGTQQRYESFISSLRRGNMDVNQAVIGYRQMSRELDGIARGFDAASPAAIKFANAARMAREEATRLVAAVGGDGGGSGGIMPLLVGRGGGGGWGPARWAAMGSLGAFGGLGLEHLLMTGVGLAGSAVGALGGGGLLGGASLATTAVGGGSDVAVMRSTIADTQTLYKTMQQGQQQVAIAQGNYNAMIAQYGKNSQQAANAQQQLAQAQAQANTQMKFQMQQLGPAAGAELALAKQTQALNTLWDKATAKARVSAVTILSQFLKIASDYVPLIANAADRNFKIIDRGLQPLFKYLEGPGKKIFQDLENVFAARLPRSVHAFVQAFELVSKVIDYVALKFLHGQFIDAVDRFFTKWNDPSNWGKVTHLVDHLVSLFESWKNLIEILAKDIYQLFHADAGTGQAIVDTLTRMLDKLHQWEISTRGQAQLHNIFEVHKQEALAMLHLLVPLVEGFGRFYMIVAPPMTRALTLIFQAIGGLLNVFVNLGNYVGGPFKTLWNDGVLIPLGAFLVAWRAWDFSTAISRFKLLGSAALALVETLGRGSSLLKSFGAAWGVLRGGGAVSPATDAASQMRLAFTEGGAEAAAAIREAMITGAKTAGVEIVTSEVAGGAEAGGALAIGGAAAAGVPGATSELSALEGGVGAGILSRVGLGGLASKASGLLGRAGTMGLGAARLGGYALLGDAAYQAFRGFTQGVPTTHPQGLGGMITGVPTSSYIRPTLTGLGGDLATSAVSFLNSVPLIGHGLLDIFGSKSQTTVALQQLQGQLRGISDPAQLSITQVKDLQMAFERILQMPDLTAKQVRELQRLQDALSPVNVHLAKLKEQWGSSFQGIDATTGAVMPQIEQIIQTHMSAISANLTTGTQQWYDAISTNYGQAIAELQSLNSQGLLSTKKMVDGINRLLSQELAKLGVSVSPTAAGGLGQSGVAIVAGAQSLGLGTTSVISPTGSGLPRRRARGGYESPSPGGRLIHVAEGGYPEVVLTTDPRFASRQRRLLAQYLRAAPQVVRGYQMGGIVEPGWTGPGGEIGMIGHDVGMIVTSAANAMLAQLGLGAGGGGGHGGGAINTAGMSGNLISIVRQISGQKGWSSGDWLSVISRESGGSMTARNPSSGAYGIAQGITGPSWYYQFPGGNPNTMIGQLTAMAEYISGRYGNPSAAWAHEQSAGWYGAGGWSPNPPHPGMDTPITGSSTIPYSTVTGYLSSVSSFSSSGISQSIMPSDISTAFTIARAGLASTASNVARFMGFVGQITSQGGLLDQLTQAIQNLFTKMSDHVITASIHVNRAGVAVQTLSPQAQDAMTATAYRTEYNQLGQQQQLISGAESSVLHQLSGETGIPAHQLSRMTPLQVQQAVARRRLSKRRSRAAHRLGLQYADLYGRGLSVSDARSQALQSLYSTEQTELQDQMTGIQNDLGTQAGGLQAQLAGMQSLGTFGAGDAGVSVTNALVANANSQISAYTQVLRKAQQEGNQGVVAQAQQQIDQLNQSITSYTTQLLQAQVAYFQQQSQYQTNALQRRSSYAQNVIAKGIGSMAPTLAAQMQLGVLQDTGTTLQGQLSTAQGLYQQAESQGNTQLANQLLDQIGQLNEAIAENTQAISDQTVTIRQTMIDWTNRFTSFQTGVFGSLYSALQTIGQISGGLNVPAAMAVTQGSLGALTGAQGTLIGALSSLTGGVVNLQGLSGTSLINALTSLPYSQIEAGMTQAQITQFEGLIGQLATNEAAIEQNTQQLMTLNGQLMQPQSFSSAGWQAFRAAMFTGMGALLPAYSTPAITPTFTGPSSISSVNTRTQNINVNVTNPTQTTDPRYLGAAVAWHASTAP